MIFNTPLIITAILIITLGLLVFIKNKTNKVNITFFILCFVLFVWQISYGIAFSRNNLEIALYWLKIGYTGVIFIPAAFCSFVLVFLQKKITKKVSVILYGISSLFTLCLWFSRLLINGAYKYFWGFYPRASLIHPIFLLYICGVISGSIVVLFLNTYTRKKNEFIGFQRLKYITWALSVGPLSSVDFIANYGIKFYPFGWIFLNTYISIVAYAIIRYRLMDISLAITRTGIFVSVYSLVLGIPFVVAYSLKPYFVGILGENWWIAPLVLSTFLATTGPFIYLFIQRKAEDRLLAEQRRYQSTLRQASKGMTRIRDLNKLLNLVVHIVTRTVRLKHGSIYLLNDKTNQYALRAIRDKGNLKPDFYLDSSSPLIWNLILQKEPIVYEEVKQRTQDYQDAKLKALEEEMHKLDAAVAIPAFVEDKLLGFIVLGEKISGKIFSQDDLSVFSVLANQSALAIENAQFYEDIKETQTQLFQAEKMATIGTMADGLSHQINNRFHALGMIAADSLDALNSLGENSAPEERQKIISQIRYGLERVKENVRQGGEVVHSLLKYSRQGEAGFEPVDLNTLIDSSLEMVQYKVKLSQIDFFRDYAKDIPKIKGNFTQLQEVFFNFIDNAFDAINQRKNELNQPNYRGNITVQAVAKDSKIEIRFIDNGMGVKDAEKERLFTPFFTTKTSSKKGTGLGLYVIQKIIVDNHKGKIFVESEYKTGTMFTIILTIAN